jgi:hypothetical protein
MDRCRKCTLFSPSNDGLCSQCWKAEFPREWEELEKRKEEMRGFRTNWEQRWQSAMNGKEIDTLKGP